MPSSPVVADIETLALQIMVEGQPLDDAYQVLAVDVEQEVNRIPSARVIIADGDITTATFGASSSSDLLPGAAIEIRAGYGTHTTSIFAGVIVGHGIRVEPDGMTTLVITAADKAAKLTLTRASVQYLQMKDSDIASQLISKAGLDADVESTSVVHKQLLQQYASAWDFIVERAEANGQLVIVRGGKVSVRTPAFSTPDTVVRLGDSIGELQADIDARTQLPTITSKAWDFSQQKVVTANSSEPSTNAQGNITGRQLLSALGISGYELQTMAAVPQPALTAWANGRLLRSRLARIRGHVSFPGNAAIVTGGTIALDGLGPRFNGTAYVTSVHHGIELGRWVTRAGFGLSPHPFPATTPDVEWAGAAGLVPPVRGLQIAQVLKTDQDPDGQRRVKVVLPMVTDGGEGVWVRMLAPYATSKAGMYFMPEVNDEVVLGFLGDDPGAAIMLGSLHSSSRAAPCVPDEKNSTKAIVTNSQLKLTFDDDKKVIQIQTPGGHVVTLSDDQQKVTIKDSNSNELVMGSSGVTLSSPSDIKINAQGSVTIEGQAGVTVKSPMDVQMDGLNVQLSAQVGLAAKGQATAELSASGQTTVRGALVMIN